MLSRIADFFALEDDWSRPVPPVGRRDVVVGLVMEAVSLFTLELARSAGAFSEVDVPWWVLYLVVSSGALALVWRRRYPVTVAVYLATHLFVTGLTMPEVMAQVSLQICYFVGLFSAMAWGRSRRTSLLATGAILVFMLCWVAWQFAVGSGLQELVDDREGEPRPDGLWPAIPSAVGLVFVINVVYFLGAIVGGQVAWRSARQRDALATQARTISAQADTLRRRAVVDERLRIARELHDVVGHHVSVIGVQAAGARRVLEHDRAAATEALGTIEASSREAVTQMRSLLGTLREMEEEAAGTADRAPEPGVSDLPALVASRDDDRLTTTYDVVADRDGGTERLSRPVSLALPHCPGGTRQRDPPLDSPPRVGHAPRRGERRGAVRRGRGARRRPTPLGDVRVGARPARDPRARGVPPRRVRHRTSRDPGVPGAGAAAACDRPECHRG